MFSLSFLLKNCEPKLLSKDNWTTTQLCQSRLSLTCLRFCRNKILSKELLSFNWPFIKRLSWIYMQNQWNQTRFKMALRSRFAHLEIWSLNFSSSWSVPIFSVPINSHPCFFMVIISLVFFYLRKLLLSGYLQFITKLIRGQNTVTVKRFKYVAKTPHKPADDLVIFHRLNLIKR